MPHARRAQHAYSDKMMAQLFHFIEDATDAVGIFQPGMRRFRSPRLGYARSRQATDYAINK